MATTTSATPTERQVLTDLFRLLEEAKGDHPALAEVRKQISERIDSFLAALASYGVDTAALLDEVDS